MLQIFAVGHFCMIYFHDFYPKMEPKDTKELLLGQLRESFHCAKYPYL